jgi:hypothetical protein
MRFLRISSGATPAHRRDTFDRQALVFAFGIKRQSWIFKTCRRSEGGYLRLISRAALRN